MGRSSVLAGTKALGLKRAEVGETVPFKRTMGEACFEPEGSGRGWRGEDFAERGVVEGVESVLLRVGGGNSVIVCAEETAGDSTISPHSSSSSPGSAVGAVGAALGGGFVSRTLRLAHGSVTVTGEGLGGSMGAMGMALDRSTFVNVRLWDAGSLGRGVRSTEVGRPP